MYGVIFISGKQGSGKSALAEKLWDHFYQKNKEKPAIKVKFADPMYAIYEGVADIMRENKVPMPDKDGKFLQMVGTWGREVKGSDVWVKILKTQVERYAMRGARLFIIDDGRMQNEFDLFPDALKIRLNAPEEVRKSRTKSWREDTNHPSEIGLDHIVDGWEIVLDTANNTREENFKKVLSIVELKFSEYLD